MDMSQWEEKYRPINNHLDENASFDGIMFETYGEEVEFVKRQNPKCIWTYAEEDDKLFIDAGWHYVNRLGYFITEVPCDDPDLQIKLPRDRDEGMLDNVSAGCNRIYDKVMAEMQEAEELGGVDNLVEYAYLMKSISEGCLERIEAALSHASAEEAEQINALLAS